MPGILPTDQVDDLVDAAGNVVDRADQAQGLVKRGISLGIALALEAVSSPDEKLTLS